MRELPLAGRLYVGAVIVVGLTLLAVCLPMATFRQPEVFMALGWRTSLTRGALVVQRDSMREARDHYGNAAP